MKKNKKQLNILITKIIFDHLKNRFDDYSGMAMDSNEALNYFMKIGIENLKGKVIGFIGELGVGKTHFVKEFSRLVSEELTGQISSPTYNLCNIYQVLDLEIHHYDLYRIETEDELYDIGILDSIENGEIVVFIEWVNLHFSKVNVCDYIVTIAMNEKNERMFNIKLPNP